MTETLGKAPPVDDTGVAVARPMRSLLSVMLLLAPLAAPAESAAGVLADYNPSSLIHLTIARP